MRKRILALALTLTLALLMIAATPALAGLNRAPLKLGKWYPVPCNTAEKNIYTMKLSSDSVVTMSIRDNFTKETYLRIFSDRSCKNLLFAMDYVIRDRGTTDWAFSKGTYYVRMYDDVKKTTSQIRITAKKAVNRDNYCRAKAVSLPAKKQVKIADTADYNYDRWYKINLKKDQYIHLTIPDDDEEYFVLYDANLRHLDCTVSGNVIVTADKQRRGTYFIRVYSTGASWFDENAQLGKLLSLSWQ